MEGSARDLLEYRKETAGKRMKLALVLLPLLLEHLAVCPCLQLDLAFLGALDLGLDDGFLGLILGPFAF